MISAVGQIQQLLPMKAVYVHGDGRVGEEGIRWLTIFRLHDICFCGSGHFSAHPVFDTFFSSVLEQLCSYSQS